MMVFVWMWYFGLSYALNETLRDEEEEEWDTLDYWNEEEFDPLEKVPDYWDGPDYGGSDYAVPDYGGPDYGGSDYGDPVIPDPGVSEPISNAVENLPAMAGAVLFLSQALGVGVFACWQRHKRASAAGIGLESGPFIPSDRGLVTTL